MNSRGRLHFARLAISGRLIVAAALAIALASCQTPSNSQPSAAADNGAPTAAPAAPASSGAAQAAPPLLPSSPPETKVAQVERPERITGTGVFAGPPAGARIDVETVADGGITLNFVNADIREVVDAVLGQTLGFSYIIDPRVQGEVTARTSRPVSRESVIPALENILALNGAALTLDNGVYKIVTLQQAATSLSSPILSTRAQESARGFAVHIIPVQFASAEALSEVLRPFVGPGRVFRVDAARNLIIFAGTGPEARDLTDMVSVFDVDWMAGMSFALFPVEVADAKAVVTDLETVFLQNGQSPLAGLIRFVPIERLNAVLVISPQPAYLDQAEAWIGRLDRGGEGAGRRIFVYHVQNGRAVDLADVLGRIFEGSEKAAKAPGIGVAPGLTPTAVASEPVYAPPAAEGGEVEAPPPPPSPAIEGLRVSDTTGIAAIPDGGNIRIIADERNNALVVLASAAEFRMIEATLKRLDITPLQVLIEVTIAEVTLNNDLRYGLQWFFRDGNNSTTFSTLASGNIAAAFPGFAYVFSSSNLRVALNALAEVTDVRVISSPQLMVLDNHSARLQVGDQVPIATQSAVSVDNPNAPIVNSIEFRDTGVILSVTPRVNAGGLVTLEVKQEVSAVTSTTTSDLNSPTIQQRSIDSTVAVQTGETIALGGLIQDQKQKSTSGVPLLSDIPVFGNLFKVTNNQNDRTELLVLITPRVVRDGQEAQDVTNELRRRMTGIEELERKIEAPQ